MGGARCSVFVACIAMELSTLSVFVFVDLVSWGGILALLVRIMSQNCNLPGLTYPVTRFISPSVFFLIKECCFEHTLLCCVNLKVGPASKREHPQWNTNKGVPKQNGEKRRKCYALIQEHMVSRKHKLLSIADFEQSSPFPGNLFSKILDKGRKEAMLQSTQ